MKNILFVHYGLDWIRGSERCLLDLLSNLDRERFNPIVWCNSETMAEEVKRLSIEVYVDPFPLLLGYEAPRFDVIGYFSLVVKGMRIAKRHEIDLIHANSGAPCQWMVPVAKTFRLPLLAQLHAKYSVRERCTFALHQVSKLIGASKSVFFGFIHDKMNDATMQVVHNGIELSKNNVGCNNYTRELLDIKKNDFLVITVGSLIDRKGVDTVILAIKNLILRNYSVKLLVVGDGPERFELQTLTRSLGIEKSVLFLGERKDVAALLRGGVDLLASGAREEAFGLVLAEAGTAGLPVVATHVGGVAEVVKNGVTGFLVEEGAVDEMAGYIEVLINNNGLYDDMSSSAIEHVNTLFSVQRYVNDVTQCYEELLNDSNRNMSWFSAWRCVGVYVRWSVGTVVRVVGRTLLKPILRKGVV